MIAACPRCSARYRIDPGRLRSDGARLRCSKCQAVFRVRPPTAEAAPQAPAPAAPAVSESVAPEPSPVAPAPQLQQPPFPRAPEAPENEPPPADRERLILVADPEVENGKTTANALANWGLTPILVHDGVEAILSIQRMLPTAVVIDAALPKMFGFQVCELLKRNESLRDIHVVLVGAIHNRARYRRTPSELYGADSYIERHQLPEALRAILTSFGMPIGGPTPSDAPSRVPAIDPPEPAPQPVAEPAAIAEPSPEPTFTPAPTPEPPAAAAQPPHASAQSDADPAIAEAERLARIVVSDIILYNQEKFDAALSQGNVVEAMENELAEGRSLFANRIDSRVRDQRDFLAERLLAVARSRGMS